MVCDTDGRAEAYAPEAHAEAVAAERQGAGTTASECPRCCTNLQRNTIKKLTAERDDWKAQAEEHLAFFQDEQRQLEAMRLECDDAIRTRNLAQEASTRDLEAKRVAEAASVRDLETIRIRGECPRHHPLDDRYGPLVCKQCADGVNAKLRADLEAANQRADEAIKQRDDWCFCLHATAEQKIKALAEVLRKEVPHAD